MKIIEVIAGFGSGGAETFLKDLTIGFKKNGHEVVVIIIDQFSDDITERSKIKQLRDNDIQVINLNRKPGDKAFLLFFTIYKLVKKNKPDIVHIHSFLAALYFFPFSFVVKAKFVQTIHNTQIAGGNLRKIIYSQLLSFAYKNVYCSEEAYVSLKTVIGEGIIIDNGIASCEHRNIRKLIEKKYNIPKKSFIVLNVGRIVEQKNQLLLLDLIELLNAELYKGSLYLLLCGKHYNDRLYRKIIGRVNQLKFGNNIKLIGVKNNVPDLMHSSDLYISSSIYEGLPVTVLEAMNAGIPLVLSPIKEHSKVFHDLEGCYIPAYNTVYSYAEIFEKNKKIFDVDKQEIINKRDYLIKKHHIDTTVLNYLECFNN